MLEVKVVAIQETGFFQKFGNQIYSLEKKLGRPIAALFHSRGITANQVSAARLIFAPLILVGFVAIKPWGWIFWEFLTIVALGMSDLVDGVMATEIEKKPKNDPGALLDSLADKLCSIIFYGIHILEFPYIVSLTIAGELLIVALVAALKLFKPNVENRNLRATLYGKAKFNFELAAGLAMLIFDATGSTAVNYSVIALGIIVLGFLALSLYTKIQTCLS